MIKPMKHKLAIKIWCAAGGDPTPHDGRYVMYWNPHTEFGTCEIVTTNDPAKARRFSDIVAALHEWETVSDRQPVRPDGEPNRPLKGLSLRFVNINDPGE